MDEIDSSITWELRELRELREKNHVLKNRLEWQDAKLGLMAVCLENLLDGLDANIDGRDGLSQQEWERRIRESRKALDVSSRTAQVRAILVAARKAPVEISECEIFGEQPISPVLREIAELVIALDAKG